MVDFLNYYEKVFLVEDKEITSVVENKEIELPVGFLERLSEKEKEKGIVEKEDKKGLIVSNLFNNTRDKNMFAFAYPLLNNPEEDYEYLVGVLPLDYVNKEMEVGRIELGDTGQPYLLDSQGNT